VLALFERIGESPEAVLAGNLVPFRSPSWKALPDRERALAFGKALWRDIFAEVNPQLVIAMGREAFTALKDILVVRDTEPIPVDWGSVCGERGSFAGGTLVGIPHLSRFPIITRSESQPGLGRLLSF
jgi:uracil-DNA glycosylase